MYAHQSLHSPLRFNTQTDIKSATGIFEHLSCFLPALLALGADSLELPAREKDLHMWAARGLGCTCWVSYSDQASGLGPDQMKMVEGEKWMESVRAWEEGGSVGGVPPGVEEVFGGKGNDYTNAQSIYLLRPEVSTSFSFLPHFFPWVLVFLGFCAEYRVKFLCLQTVESFYLLWKTTGDSVWRDRGWAVFEAIERQSRTAYGYASISGVEGVPAHQNDDMPRYVVSTRAFRTCND